MSLLVASATRQYLIAEKNDLQYKIMLIQQAKMELNNSSNDLINAGADLNPDSPTVKELNLRKERLKNLETKLDLEIAEYQARLEMVEGMLAKAKELQSKSIRDLYGQ